MHCTIASIINVIPKNIYLPISKLHSILAVANLLAYNNIGQICYSGQISFDRFLDSLLVGQRQTRVLTQSTIIQHLNYEAIASWSYGNYYLVGN